MVLRLPENEEQNPDDFEVQIATAEEKHLYSITALTKHFFPYTGFNFETIKQRVKGADIHYFVALHKGHTVGFADVEIQHDGNAKLLGLAVLKELQGKGVGKKLLQKALDFAKTKKCPKAFLLVAEDNETALKLYEQSGFTRKGVLEQKLGGKTILLYEKTL